MSHVYTRAPKQQSILTTQIMMRDNLKTITRQLLTMTLSQYLLLRINLFTATVALLCGSSISNWTTDILKYTWKQSR